MPKIISNSIVSSSDNRDDQQQGLHSYYCLCSEFILVIDMELGQLPRRETDNAIIISNATRMYKLHGNQGDTKIVKRGDKFEKQYRLSCQRCHLLIAYETTPHLKGGPYTYIVQGALNEMQGVPPEDWELDLPNGQVQDATAEAATKSLSVEEEEQQELKRRMDKNQAAAANARAMIAAAAGSSS